MGVFETYEDDEPGSTNSPDYPFPPAAQGTRKQLRQMSPLHVEDYTGFKETLLIWLLTQGKTPHKREGYSTTTIRGTHYKLEMAYRWKWEQEGEYTTAFTPDDADELVPFLMEKTPKTDHWIDGLCKALKRLFKFFNENRGHDYSWEPPEDISPDYSSRNLDYLKKHELRELADACIDAFSIKHYENYTPEERDEMKQHLAISLQKPKDEVTVQDFHDANSWKFPSLISMTLDLGFRPIEVNRAKTTWLNLEDNEAVIPEEESSKSENAWECELSTESVRRLQNWLSERDALEKYDDTDALWLTRKNNGYTSNSLNKVLQNKLLPYTGIEERNREITWYSIRRGVATVWANEENLTKAAEQLRHKKLETTKRYVQSGGEISQEQTDSKW